MNGKVVGEFKASSRLPMQKRTAIVMASPSTPFKSVEEIILRGMIIDASLISSAIESQPCNPVDAKYPRQH